MRVAYSIRQSLQLTQPPPSIQFQHLSLHNAWLPPSFSRQTLIIIKFSHSTTRNPFACFVIVLIFKQGLSNRKYPNTLSFVVLLIKFIIRPLNPSPISITVIFSTPFPSVCRQTAISSFSAPALPSFASSGYHNEGPPSVR